MRPIAVPTPPESAHALPLADFADTFAIGVNRATLDAPTAVQIAFAQQPGWITNLLALRNALMSPFGLKTGADTALPDNRRVGIFPVISSQTNQVVPGFDDYHLNFRIVVDVSRTAPTTHRVTLTTLVQRNNIFGRAYLAAVMPFPKLIVPATLARLA